MDPITREEKLMAGEQLEPITRKEYFLAKAAGMDVETPEPITREEMFLSMISGGGTGGSGGADWNAKEGEPGYVNNRPFWKEGERVPTTPGQGPITVTTADNGNGFYFAGAPVFVVPGAKNYVIFDGVEYECEPYSDETGQYLIGAENFVDYPFCIMSGAIITATAGTYTIEQYYEITKIHAEYAPCLEISTPISGDNMPYLDMESVEKIRIAWDNGIPVRIGTVHHNQPKTLHVSKADYEFITAIGCFAENNLVKQVVQMYSAEDGRLYMSSCSTSGTILEGGNYLPVMDINNRQYKITVGESGNLVATEIT